MWLLALTPGGQSQAGGEGASVSPSGSQEVFTEHCSGHHGNPSPPFSSLVLNGKEDGKGEEVE